MAGIRKLQPYESDQFRPPFDRAISIDEVLRLAQNLPGLIPVADERGIAIKHLSKEEMRRNIEQVRHGHRALNYPETSTPKPGADFNELRAFSNAEEQLPSFAGIRNAVRRLLETDRTYQKSQKRAPKLTSKPSFSSRHGQALSARQQQEIATKEEEKRRRAQRQAERDRLDQLRQENLQAERQREQEREKYLARKEAKRSSRNKRR